MSRFIPLDAFEHDGQAVIAVDYDSRIQFCNRAARRLLGLSPSDPLSDTCWKLLSFRALDGGPFCREDCPVRTAARDGRPGAQHWAVPSRGRNAPHPVEIVSFFVSGDSFGRVAVLHFLRAASVATANGTSESFVVSAAGHLSGRETEVLRFLTEGYSTPAIAGALGVATNTVRNHLASIFHKLGVHSRVGAMAAFSRTVAQTVGPETR